MMQRMRRTPWFLLLAIVLQLCLGSAWARAGVDVVRHAGAVDAQAPAAKGQSLPNAADEHAVAPPHCHEVAGIDQADGAQSDGPLAKAGACCCDDVSHCPLCNVVGLPLQSVVHPRLPIPTHQLEKATVVVSWTHPPELRPPI